MSQSDNRSELGRTLRGIKVLDLTRNLAGPYCTMILGDLGADVIKIERPGTGDDTRGWSPPEWNGLSTVFLSANRNKRSMAVDLNNEKGLAIVRRLAAKADVIVESFRPGSLAKRGLDYDSLKTGNPGIIFCSISAFGSEGPMRDDPGYDPVMQAASGMMAMTGEPGQGAVRIPVSLVDMGAAMWAAIGILSALRNRDQTGEGTLVETSLFETSAWWLNYHIVGYLASGRNPERWGSGTAMIAPYEVFPTADDGLLVGAANDNLFRKFSEALGVPEMAKDVRFWTNAARVENRTAMQQIIRDRMRARPSAEWETIFKQYGIPYSRVHSIADLVDMDQFKAINILQPVPHPDVPDLRLIDLPFKHNHDRTQQPCPPPRLGEHTDQVLAEFGFSEAERRLLKSEGVIQ